jgi:hypothetical protein
MIGKRGSELNMAIGTMTPEKSITIGKVDEHKTALLQRPEERALFQGRRKSEETTLFRTTARGKPGSSLSFTTAVISAIILLRPAQGTTVFHDHAVKMQLILYCYLDGQIQLHGLF